MTRGNKIFLVIAIVVAIPIIILGFLSVVRYAFTPYYVVSDSMEPTITKNDWNVVSRFHYRFSDIERGDIVLFKQCSDFFEKGLWMHRVVALPGDNVKIQKGIVTVNDSPAMFPDTLVANQEILVPEGFVYQKGDNKKSIVGLAPINCVAGKVIYTKKNVY